MTATDKRDVYLTIVPEDMDEASTVLDTIVDDSLELPRLPVATTDEKPKKAAVLSPYAPANTPKPAPSRLPAAMAGLMGGVFIGGAGVAALCVVLMGTAAVAGAGAWWMTQTVAVAEPVPVEAAMPVEDVAPDATPADEADEAPEAAPVEAPAPAAPASGTDEAEPAAPAPVPAKPAAPVAPPPAAPGAASSTVKLVSSPPAAVVFIDGVDVGRTPLKTDLPAGTHSVTIESGKATGTFTIDASSQPRFCFAASGRKVTQTSCD